MQRAVIVSACRTPIGSFQGKLCRLSATQLGSVVIKEALDRTRLVADQVVLGGKHFSSSFIR